MGIADPNIGRAESDQVFSICNQGVTVGVTVTVGVAVTVAVAVAVGVAVGVGEGLPGWSPLL